MSPPPELVPLAWCVLGYFFLDGGESAFAIVASMAAISAACWGPGPGAMPG